MKSVIIKIKSTFRIIPVRGKLVRTTCDIIVNNERELKQFVTILHAQGIKNFTIEEFKERTKKNVKPEIISE